MFRLEHSISFMVERSNVRIPRPVRFLLTGAANTFVGVAVIFGLKGIFDANDYLANAFGYLTGLIVSFTGNAGWTFSFGGPRVPAAARFVALVAIAYLANVIGLSVAKYWIGMNSYLAQLVGIVPYTALMYFGMKHFVFPGDGAGEGATDGA